jgi:hypothetical protein
MVHATPQPPDEVLVGVLGESTPAALGVLGREDLEGWRVAGDRYGTNSTVAARRDPLTTCDQLGDQFAFLLDAGLVPALP